MSMSGVYKEIWDRRAKQIAKGYDAAHDDTHANGSIALAASAYAGRTFWKNRPHGPYPWGKMPEGTPREDLLDAAALCIAEIERLDRLPPPTALLSSHMTEDGPMRKPDFTTRMDCGETLEVYGWPLPREPGSR